MLQAERERLSIVEAALRHHKSYFTIQRHIKKGDFLADRDARGWWHIDPTSLDALAARLGWDRKEHGRTGGVPKARKVIADLLDRRRSGGHPAWEEAAQLVCREFLGHPKSEDSRCRVCGYAV